jgi:hypothetical protein
MKRFEELLADVMDSVAEDVFAGHDVWSDATKAARSALVEYVDGLRRQRDERTAERDRWHATARQRLLEGVEFKAERDAARKGFVKVTALNRFAQTVEEREKHERDVAYQCGWDYLYETPEGGEG